MTFIFKTIEQQQEALALLGCYRLRYKQEPRKGDIAIDRLKGPHLTKAIRVFQQENGIKEDGLWGPETERAVRLAIYEGRVRQAPPGPRNPEDIPKTVHDYLKAKGFSEAATAGIMGNISAESNMRPTNMEDQYQSRLGYDDDSYTAAVDDDSYTNFTGDAVGYGLCQWTYWTRKTGLLSAAKTANKSIGDLQVQLDWLWHELTTQYSGMVRQLMNPGISIYDATSVFMRTFENPADQSDAAIARRAGISQGYYNKYK